MNTADIDSDAHRWEDAEQLLRNPSGRPLARGLQDRSRRRWLIAGVVLVVVVAAGAGIAAGMYSAHHSPSPHHSSPTPRWRTDLGVALEGVGLVGVVLGAVRGWRGGLWRATARTPTRLLTRQQRRELVRQIRGQRPADPAHLPLARNLATLLEHQTGWASFTFGGLALVESGNAVSDRGIGSDVFHSVLVVVFVLGVVVVQRNGRRAHAFLEDQPNPSVALNL